MKSDGHAESQERRKFPRISVGVSIFFPHLQTRVLCRDISKEGCYFQDLDLGPVGQTYSLFIDLPKIGLIPLEAQVAHKGESGQSTGLHFLGIDPLDAEKLTSFVDIFGDA